LLCVSLLKFKLGGWTFKIVRSINMRAKYM